MPAVLLRRALLGNTTEDCPLGMDYGTFALGVAVWLGTFVSYLPQIIKIHKRHSHIGLNFPNFLCGTVVTNNMALGYITLEYLSTFDCCGLDGATTYDCIASYLVLFQLLSSVLCSNFILAQYFYHYDHDAAQFDELQREAEAGSTWRKAKHSLYFYFAFTALTIALAVGFMVGIGVTDDVTETYGRVLGIFTGALISVHWLPQLVTSWRLGHPGSLSVIMLLLQSGGSLLAAYNEYQHGGLDDWDAWGPFLVVAIMQYAVLFELIYLVKCTERGAQYKLFDFSDKRAPEDMSPMGSKRLLLNHEAELDPDIDSSLNF